MSFDKIFDLTAGRGVYYYFFLVFLVPDFDRLLVIMAFDIRGDYVIIGVWYSTPLSLTLLVLAFDVWDIIMLRLRFDILQKYIVSRS